MNRGSNRDFDPRNNRRSGSVSYRQAYGHSPASIGSLAHKNGMRPSTVIQLFREAGIRGLTPNHIVDPLEWATLRTYVQSVRQSEAQEIYQDAAPPSARGQVFPFASAGARLRTRTILLTRE